MSNSNPIPFDRPVVERFLREVRDTALTRAWLDVWDALADGHWLTVRTAMRRVFDGDIDGFNATYSAYAKLRLRFGREVVAALLTTPADDREKLLSLLRSEGVAVFNARNGWQITSGDLGRVPHAGASYDAERQAILAASALVQKRLAGEVAYFDQVAGVAPDVESPAAPSAP